MINNDWLQGYIAALANIKVMCEKSATITISDDEKNAFEEVAEYINQVRRNYKDLVEKHNENKD